jgi:predicted deacylase
MRAVAVSAGIVFLAVLASCGTTPLTVPAGEVCTTTSYSISDDFEGARRGRCTVLGDTSVRLEIVREDVHVVNPSSWYAFKLIPSRPVLADIELDYGTWPHRYPPKISDDGKTWRPLRSSIENPEANGSILRFQTQLGREPVWIAAQELVLQDDYEKHYREVANDVGATFSTIGYSVGARPIFMLENLTTATDVVLLSGRQHPPEVSGSIAMLAFTTELFSKSELATEFRHKFRIIVIPLLNPDGVAAGNWRHNAAGVDLNRDWGPFTQPETQVVKELLDELDAGGLTLHAFLDFHSTTRNVFYTQAAAEMVDPDGFTQTWFALARARLEDYSFAVVPGSTPDQANAKNYIGGRYGIPSMTYEVGDETDRQAVMASAEVFAEEFMRLLLKSH